MSDSGRLTRSRDRGARSPAENTDRVVGTPREEPVGPDRGREHLALYIGLTVILVVGSFFLRGDNVYSSGYAWHSVLEAVATVLAFIIGALALVRYYSRKRITFLLIGCGFLGAALLDLNHALRTSDAYIDVLQGPQSRLERIARLFLELDQWADVPFALPVPERAVLAP